MSRALRVSPVRMARMEKMVLASQRSRRFPPKVLLIHTKLHIQMVQRLSLLSPTALMALMVRTALTAMMEKMALMASPVRMVKTEKTVSMVKMARMALVYLPPK